MATDESENGSEYERPTIMIGPWKNGNATLKFHRVSSTGNFRGGLCAAFRHSRGAAEIFYANVHGNRGNRERMWLARRNETETDTAKPYFDNVQKYHKWGYGDRMSENDDRNGITKPSPRSHRGCNGTSAVAAHSERDANVLHEPPVRLGLKVADSEQTELHPENKRIY